MITPAPHSRHVLRRLTAQRPAYEHLHLRAADATTLSASATAHPWTEDVELVHDLDVAPAPARRVTSPPGALVVTMEAPIEDLDGTILQTPIDDLVNVDAGDADRKRARLPELTKTMSELGQKCHCDCRRRRAARVRL